VSVSRTVLQALILLPMYAKDASATEAYLDRLIDPGAAAVPEEDYWLGEEHEPEGRRFYSIEYQHYQQDYIASSTQKNAAADL